ncbi:MAG: hypothetical protein DWQ51_03220 [Microcystis wesenbergii TW10]|uniref:Uncharacterized protein n=4 Tax=Microcystis TaxID=1125 RepID=A0A0A1VVP2_MICAE|nr:hypothetical protein [Microcystis wesenbergii]MDT3674245.1 hypothetical protein [Microcystis wesenbergii NRERC-220]REJ57151.1 MAG: hypothetical protein DWQ51_03220 [Microcystis wesenbergii TW10]TRT90918.1 MAG: hypothetical protein EWV63_00080 [Microcystis aeruginosa Ma_OC_H_19870700_S124]GAL93805.1 hypothetical protein N44_03557 [Microcystis aeruginosa NIES-44]
MRNVNLNILKFLASINKFCLSLANIGLGVSILRVSFFLPSPFSQLRRSRKILSFVKKLVTKDQL